MTNHQSYPSILSFTSTVAKTATEELVSTIVSAADDRKAANIVVLKVSEICYLTDYLVIVSGFSRTQVKAIADAVEEKVAQILSRTPQHIEGKTEASWILQDYGDVILHIFLPSEREFYNLEAFWGHGERVTISLEDK